MPQTQIACPQCRQMIPAQVEQLFDVTSDPGAKQRLLSGASNRAQCPHCGYQGNLATPIVYHDNEKELLLTFFPSELGMPVNEQEKLIGPFITQITNKLPPEKRKAYLFRSQNFLTMQSLIERILAADGITKEMIDDQQKRMNVIQSLIQASGPEIRSEIIKQNHELVDEVFFSLFARLFEAAMASGQQEAAQALNAIQSQLLQETEYGKKLQGQVAEMEAAVKTLQDVGQGLTREKLLDIFIEAPTEARLQALVSMTRNGLDYEFFALLTSRIDKASGTEKDKFEELRAKLLDYVNEIDKRTEEQLKEARAFIEELLKQPDIALATQQNLDQVNDTVIQVINSMLKEAQQQNNTDMLSKLQQVVGVLQQASAPPELAVIEQFLSMDEKDYDKELQKNAELITDEFMNLLGGLMNQMDGQPQDQLTPEDQETFKKVEALYRAALRFNMKKNMA